MSRGRKLVPEIEFSTAGMMTRSRTLSLRAMIMWPSASAVAAPAMSFFMLSMPASVLMSRPPVSKHTPLPTSVTFGSPSLPQVMSISRGARRAGADRGDQRELLGERVASGDFHGCAMLLGERAGGVFQLGRAHVVGRRVDEIARQRHAFDDAGEVVAVDAVRHHQPHIAFAPCGSG